MDPTAQIILAYATLATAIFAGIAGLVAAVMSAKAAGKATAAVAEVKVVGAVVEQVKATGEATHLSTNSKMEKLLELTAVASKAEGKLEEKTEAAVKDAGN